MNKQEMVAALGHRFAQQMLAKITDDVTSDQRRSIELSAQMLGELSSAQFEANFDIYEDLFAIYFKRTLD